MCALMAHIKPSIFRNIFLGIEKVVNTFSISDKIFQKMINYCVPFGHTLAKSFFNILKLTTNSNKYVSFKKKIQVYKYITSF